MSTTITKSQLREHIAKLVAEQVKALSADGQKALEQSKVAKQNKDAQKKRAAAKDSMKGISVEAVDPLDEQNSATQDIASRKILTAKGLSRDAANEINRISNTTHQRIMNLIDELDFEQGRVFDLVPVIQDFEFLGFLAVTDKGEFPIHNLTPVGSTMGEQSSWHRNQNGELADLYKTKYRVNFGQGQVSNTFPTRKEAEYEMTFLDEPNAFIQFKDLDTGEWFNIKHLKEQRIEGDKLHSDEMDFFDTDEFHDDGLDDPWDSDPGEPYDDFEDHVELGYGEPDSGSYDLYDDMSDDDLDRKY